MGFGTSSQITELAKRSGFPFKVSSTFRPGAITKSGNISHHAKDNAVDFGGYDQDELAEYFMQFETLEVFHKSRKTGRWYGKSRGKPVDEKTHQQLVKDHINHLHVAMSPEQVASVPKGSLLSMLPGASGILSPFSAAASMVDIIRPFGIAGTNLINPNFYRRIGMGVLGSALILFGFLYIQRRAFDASGLGQTVKGLAGTAVQGAAFGAGAGATGLGSAKATASASSVAPRTGPYPPRKALPSNAPTTAVLPEAYAPVSAGGTYEVTSAVGRAKNPTQYHRPKGGSLIGQSSARVGQPGGKKKAPQESFKPTISAALRNEGRK